MLSIMSDMVERLNAALEGRYAIERKLGEGGMATVYLAEDLKHRRSVALKVLKPELAAVVGAERFLAEIEVTANLQHPNILPLHDSGEADGFLFYVMPYVEGDTLQDRLDREHQLPVGDAVQIATDIAEALDYAHRQGVIHRDIKPANVLMLEGKPVLSDFGIALALSAAGAGERLTETGLSLGTPHYMSPEQATGDQHVGAPSDTYALGAVLYEMLVGEPPYAGTTAQAVLGKIIGGKPVSAKEHRPSIPANVDAALRCALEKLPADRFTSGQDFVRALRDEHFRYGEAVVGLAGAGSGPWKWLTMALAGTTVVFGTVLAWSLLRPDPPEPLTRFSVLIPADQPFHPDRDDVALSPDGLLMVYRGLGDDGRPHLWARRWNDLRATRLRGTEGAGHPAISPDGLEVAFDQAGAIRVVRLEGGPPRTVSEGENPIQPGWSPDGAWLYYNGSGGIRRAPSAGGPVEIITEINTAAGETAHAFPGVLPGGGGVIYQTISTDPWVQAVDLETGEVKNFTPGRYPRYSSTGHLLFLDEDATLLAAPLDVERLELTGVPRPVAEQLAMNPNGMGFYDVSETGTLAYRTGGIGNLVTPLWVNRNGRAQEIDPEWRVMGDATYSSLALSPDGARLALSILDSEGRWDLWVKRLDTGPLSRLTFEGTENLRAAWSDAQSLTFVSNREGDYRLWTKRADGSGTAELVLDREAPVWEGLYSSDGTWLVFRDGPNAAADIYAIRPGVDSVAVPLEVTEFQERSVALSPNGRWLAYVSNRSGRNEVYVRPFPDADASLQQVSADGGVEPVWAHSGRELFYRNGANELVAVEVTDDPTFAAGPQQVLFSMTGYLTSNGRPQYDVSADDQRFVMLRIVDQVDDAELILVENWLEGLR